MGAHLISSVAIFQVVGNGGVGPRAWRTVCVKRVQAAKLWTALASCVWELLLEPCQQCDAGPGRKSREGVRGHPARGCAWLNALLTRSSTPQPC